MVDGYGRAIVSLAYDDESPWPQGADGEGYSLVLNNERSDDQDPNNWRRSSALGGSPGNADPQPVRINELLSNPVDGADDRVELYNVGDQPADISHWTLTDDPTQPAAYRIADGVVIPPGGHLALAPHHFDSSASRSTRPDFNVEGGEIYLFSADGSGVLTGYRHGFDYGASEPGVSLGLVTTTDGREHFVQQERPSFGEANAGPLVGPVVISEIDYRPSNSDEFIELTNISDQPVKLYDPLDPTSTWRIDGIFYEFPTGVEIPAGGSLLVVAERPSDACLARREAGETIDKQPQIIGPYPVHLADGGQTITLLKPAPSVNDGGERAYIEIDRVDYDDGWPWPVAAAGQSSGLRRVDLAGFGNEPTNWQEVSAQRVSDGSRCEHASR